MVNSQVLEKIGEPMIGDPTNANRVMSVGANGHGQVDVNNFPSTQIVDGSAVTQPISAAALPLPTGAATSANQSTLVANQTNGLQTTQVINPVQVAAATLSVSVTGVAASSAVVTSVRAAATSGSFSTLAARASDRAAFAAAASPTADDIAEPLPLARTRGCSCRQKHACRDERAPGRGGFNGVRLEALCTAFP